MRVITRVCGGPAEASQKCALSQSREQQGGRDDIFWTTWWMLGCLRRNKHTHTGSHHSDRRRQRTSAQVTHWPGSFTLSTDTPSGRASQLLQRLARKESEVWWRWAKSLCKDESEWLSAIEADNSTRMGWQVGTVYGRCVWMAAGGSHRYPRGFCGRERHGDGRRDRGRNERKEMSRDRQAEGFGQPLPQASVERYPLSIPSSPNQRRNWFGRLEKPLFAYPTCISHPISQSILTLFMGYPTHIPG